MTIRSETPEDISAIHIVIEQAFGRAAEADLVNDLRRNGKAILSLVAEDAGGITGHILFSRVTVETDEGELSGVGLAPLAVIPDKQNQGTGSMLVEEGLIRLRKDGHRFAVVLGHPHYYPRFGFVPASRFNIKSEYNVADEVFMAMELQDGGLQIQAGLAKYQPEFNREW